MKIELAEVLRYLGYANQKIDSQTKCLIEAEMREALLLGEKQFTYGIFNLEIQGTTVFLLNSNLIIESADLAQHLKFSDKCVVMAATIGLPIEKRINYYSKLDLARAVVLDACASVLVESLCNQVQEQIASQLMREGWNLTSRYSPGYGDFSLAVQPNIINVLGASQKISLWVTEDYLLLPRKSVTALIGMEKGAVPKQWEDKCQACPQVDCFYRKEGSNCAQDY